MNKRIPILLGFILVVISVWLQITDYAPVRAFIIRVDNLTYDLQLRTRLLTHPVKLKSPIVVVDIDDRSLRDIGRWPWDRETLSNLITRLKDMGVVVIAMDMMFPESEPNVTDVVSKKLVEQGLANANINASLSRIATKLDNDMILAESFKTVDVVTGMTFLPTKQMTGMLPPPLLTLKNSGADPLGFIAANGYISNIPILQKNAKAGGFLNVFPDTDGIIRRVPLLMRFQDDLYPSLAFSAVQLFLLQKAQLVVGEYNRYHRLEAVKLGDHTVPVDASGQVLIPFVGKSFTFPYFSAVDILRKQTPEEAFQGKIAFIGTSATGMSDLRPTSVEAVFPGLEVQATIADGILTDNFSYRPEWTLGAEITLSTSLGVLLAILFAFLGPRALTLLLITIPVLIILANNMLWEETGLILFTFIPITLTILLALLNIVWGYLFETRRREKLKDMFGQYVPGEHIDEMLRAKGSYALHGEAREMTVLFADIRNFTAISERLSATDLKELLNEFFTPMTEVIFKNHGTIDKYIGDLIMAFWGAPLKDKKHAEHALTAALEMQQATAKLKQIFAENGWDEVVIGIGLNTGTMSVGDMGSKFRRNYTVLGDAVNLASRTEELTKFYGVKIIASEFTQKNQKKFLFRELDRVRVKGKKIAISIYEVVALLAQATPELLKEIELSQQAFHYYLQQQWGEAKAIYQALHEQYPHKKLYRIYLERIALFEITPPSVDWDGVYAHEKKSAH